jgi:hypothetical protein
MSKVEKIKTFNEIVEDLLKQLAPIIGTSYHFYFKKLIKMNAVLPIQQFMEYAEPLQEKILKKDESYFLNESNHENQVKDFDSGLDEILRLKGIWEQLDEKSKEELWNFTQALLIIGLEYNELKGSR